jgi:L-alanine-DL-glutamate epimerase-like enolase superfamily enzyme
LKIKGGHDPDLLARVTNQVPLPVMADESLMTLRDTLQLAQDDIWRTW